MDLSLPVPAFTRLSTVPKRLFRFRIENHRSHLPPCLFSLATVFLADDPQRVAQDRTQGPFACPLKRHPDAYLPLEILTYCGRWKTSLRLLAANTVPLFSIDH